MTLLTTNCVVIERSDVLFIKALDWDIIAGFKIPAWKLRRIDPGRQPENHFIIVEAEYSRERNTSLTQGVTMRRSIPA